MKRYWSVEELEDFWKLLPEEKILLGKKHGVQKFLYLLFLKYYSIDYQLPECSDDIPKTLINFGLRQYGITLDTNDIIEFLNTRHNYIKYQKEIRSFYGTCLFSAADQQMIVGHVYKLALETVKEDKLAAELILLLKRLKIEKPNKNIIQDLIKQSLIAAETYLYNHIDQSLTTDQHNYIDHNLLGLEPTTEEMLITYLKQDSGKSNRDAIAVELDKLHVLQGLKLTTTIIPADISPAVLKFYRRKVISDTLNQLKNRPKQISYAEIGSQKIYLPEPEFNCKNINEIMTRTINWDLIIEHYDTLIQYTVALKIGTATADSIVRQFSKTNFQHPVFKAFIELGRAVKSIFLCRYLFSLDLRQEIHTGLNIVENWNSINDFIFYGKKSEINSNSRDEQEYSVLCLHLLQLCLTYVNILLVQDIINTESWLTKLTIEDKRGITPLFNGHINPYGTFELDMSKRILLKEAA
ncbi:MAG: Tn3 family transposase [Rickettsia sp.]|uniref:Tn3 family transposase n=1 Tax=Rickettsia sp. TaxID=789 RepID=UPI00397DE8E1